ncbi:MAG TPA: hypothetical protein PLJ21_05695 [Pseudobdellovibrionaceae bacterium]|nr:hypothetical protein [Pseudobdellovibrionaceae bacterium]
MTKEKQNRFQTVPFKKLYFTLGFLFILIATNPVLGESTKSADPITELQKISKNFEKVKLNIHYVDQARIFLLQKNTARCLDSISTNGPFHVETRNSLHHLIVRFRFSSQMFESIRTQMNSKPIYEILASVEALKKGLGFDDEPYTKALLYSLDAIKFNIDEILKLETAPKSLKSKLQIFIGSSDKNQPYAGLLSESRAKAALGDRPMAFKSAAILFCEMRKLYEPLKNTIGSDYKSLSLVLELIGQNEFIGEYGQVSACP